MQLCRFKLLVYGKVGVSDHTCTLTETLSKGKSQTCFSSST